MTLPSFLKAGLSLARASTVMPARGCSSVSKLSGSPLRCGTWIGVISSLTPALDGGDGLLLRSGGEGVLLLAGQAVLLRRVLPAVMPMW